ncbi:hypothetical protein RF11_03501 [Thelohanellus kitauei]|uniref:39S ribosomal protein L18, mitochondrial n=1 Tax=Thelohanellus kitauei TaxID=669202 RepID=A0A0C2J6T5_THEKT|nr:hypothetical protein RF11_03501 [Thelohanellus kitauei]
MESNFSFNIGLRAFRCLKTVSPATLSYSNSNPMYTEHLGYLMPRPGYRKHVKTRSFFKRLDVHLTDSYVMARVFHHRTGGVLASASSYEHGFITNFEPESLNDTAYIIATLFAQRCLWAGITQLTLNGDLASKAPALELKTFLGVLKAHKIQLPETRMRLPKVLTDPKYFSNRSPAYNTFVEQFIRIDKNLLV